MSGTNIFRNLRALRHSNIATALFAVLVTFSYLNIPALANAVIYSAPSDNQNACFTGEVPLKQIGSLLLPKAVVQFKSTEVNILAVPDWLFDRSIVLSGALVK